jgi:hypothetical protein
VVRSLTRPGAANAVFRRSKIAFFSGSSQLGTGEIDEAEGIKGLALRISVNGPFW